MLKSFSQTIKSRVQSFNIVDMFFFVFFVVFAIFAVIFPMWSPLKGGLFTSVSVSANKASTTPYGRHDLYPRNP